MNSIILLLSFTVLTLPTFASELRMSREQALKQGFKPHPILNTTNSENELPKNSLAWPVQFIDSKHNIGNSMLEYQNYSNEAYYHAGADLRLSRAGQVTAPIDGFLQGDFYTYVTNPETGEDKKYTKPITEGGDELYFELTIKTADNYQLELHHVSPNSLPKSIHELVLRGGGMINKGEVLGSAAIWPVYRFGERYDHIHYNLISPDGVYLNPEYYSLALPDKTPPVIKNIFAVYGSKKVEVKDQKLNGLPSELIVSALDMKGDNVYPLPPTLIMANWSKTFKTGWDFTQRLLTLTGLFPDIREVYARNLRLSDGRSFTTKGDYTNTVFLFRLKIPSTTTSPITIEVQDASNNKTEVNLTVLN